MTFTHSDRVILTFDNDLADERSESDDDLSCLGVRSTPHEASIRRLPFQLGSQETGPN